MVFILLLVTILFERLLFIPLIWKRRRLYMPLLMMAISLATTLVVYQTLNWFGALIALLGLLRMMNILRIAEARMHDEYLYRTTNRTSLLASLAQALVVAVLISPLHIASLDVITLLVVACIAMATLLLGVTVKNVYKTRYRQGSTFYSDKELPTVSLLIPARNETSDLEECLRSALMTDYPKLEIIALDDCSHLETSEVIKGFAHDGVRFVKGLPPAENWLAKNQAYEKLSSEASGELLLFCGVDVRFGPNAIKALVTELLTRDKQMISILPHRLSGSVAGAFIQPMRYWWELSLPRKLFNRPPVLSTCWLIRKKSFLKLGGFKAVSRSIVPEGYFARELVKSNNYSFIRANDTLDIQTRKSFAEQRATTLRTRYPQLRRRPENVLAIALFELVFLLGPFIGIIYGLFSGQTTVTLGFAIAAALLVINHVFIVQLTSPANVAVALVSFPIEVITELTLLFASMLRYEFGEVRWKDRNICIPVMHVIPRLPKLE